MAFGFTAEFASNVAPDRIFQAGAVDMHKIARLIMPHVVSGAKIIEGDGGVGTIRQVDFTEAVPYRCNKERIDVLDEEDFEYKYTQIEGRDVGKKFASATYHVKLVPTDDGGCVCKISCEYTPLAGVRPTEEDLEVMKKEVLIRLESLEDYLLANPEAYA